MSQRASWTALGAMLALLATGALALAQERSRVEIADKRLVVATAEGSGLLPLFLSPDWGRRRPDVIRVLIIFHGNGRNANSYFNTAKKARRLAGEQGRGTLIVAPQFLAKGDLKNDPPDDAPMLLHWTTQTWKDGEPALGPAPLSSFEAIDAVIARLADRTIFPNLVHVVVAGHSAGGQIVQRYAIVGTGLSKLTAIGVHVRYVVANPSSYAYFNEDRPYPTADCPTFDNWKYGMKKRPPYAANPAPANFERTYAEREVVYLLGSDDIDPHAEELDQRCEAEVQGKYRRARGEAYFAYMQKRHPSLGHRLQLVPGVAHSAGQMFTSTCGVSVLFDRPGCERD
jgi:pimeloyl-ACP methyl ester carboxylesterase